jgi:membrane-bound lytic murein transglycosylase B
VSAPPQLGIARLRGTKRTVAQWSKLGVRKADGGELPASEIRAELVQGGDANRYFLVYDNFKTILAWNNSRFFALAVGLLADRVDD